MSDKVKTMGFSGGRGFVGSHLAEWFSKRGFRIVYFDRKALSGTDFESLVEPVQQCDIVINLAGATLNKRWSSSYKREIYNSRIITTRNLVKAINQCVRVELFISTLAVGIYPSDECYDEGCNHFANTFLGRVCRDWERESRAVKESVRVVNTRFGIVFSPNGGAYPKMILPFRCGVATTFGDRRNMISWVDIRDLVQIFDFIINDEYIDGVVNITSPHPMSQEHFAETLGCYYSTLLKVNISKRLLHFAMGESHALLTESCCVFPTRIQQFGYNFQSPDIHTFLY